MNGHCVVFCDCLCLFSLFYLLIYFVGNGKIVRSRLFYIPDQHICNGTSDWSTSEKFDPASAAEAPA